MGKKSLFLAIFVLFLLPSLGAAALPSSKKFMQTSAKGTLLFPVPGALKAFSLEDNSVQSIPIPNVKPRLVVLSPTEPQVAVVLDSGSPLGSVVDLAKRKILSQFRAKDGLVMSGSGYFSTDGTKFYLGQNSIKASKESFVVAFRTRDWSVIGRFPISCSSQVGLTALSKNEILAIACGDEKQRVLFLHAESGKELSEVPVAQKNGHLGQVERDGQNWIVVGSNPLFFGTMGQAKWIEAKLKSSSKDLSEKMKGQSVVRVDRFRHRAIVLHPESKLLSTWDLGSGRLVESKELEGLSPASVALNGLFDSYLLYGTDQSIHFLHPDKLTPMREKISLKEAGIPGNVQMEFLPFVLK